MKIDYELTIKIILNIFFRKQTLNKTAMLADALVERLFKELAAEALEKKKDQHQSIDSKTNQKSPYSFLAQRKAVPALQVARRCSFYHFLTCKN